MIPPVTPPPTSDHPPADANPEPAATPASSIALRPSADDHTLDDDVALVIGRLRSAYADLLAALPEATGTAIAVERSLGLNKKLAWQVFRVATAPTPLLAGSRVPGPAAAQQVIRAARRAGIDTAILDRIAVGTDDFTATVRDHADDRSSFDLMVRAVSGDDLGARDAELKRAAFRANRQLVGRYCEADVYTLLVVPGNAPGTVHMCSLRGLVGLRRLRPGVRLEISRHRFDRGGDAVDARTPLDLTKPATGPNGDADSPADAAAADDPTAVRSVLHAFSSDPLPPIRQSVSPDGFVRTFLDTESLGRRSAATCFLSDVNWNSHYRSPDGSAGVGHIHRIATPARVLIQDCLIDERLVGDRAPEVRLLAGPNETDRWPADDRAPLLPLRESVEYLGRGAASAADPEVPRYPEMIDAVAGRLDWDVDRMLVHRTRIDHPMLQSVVWMRFDLGD